MGRYQSCVDGQLHSSEDGQPLCHDLEPPCVGAAASDAKVPRFSADLLHRTLHCETTSARNPCPATNWPSQEEDPERLRIHPPNTLGMTWWFAGRLLQPSVQRFCCVPLSESLLTSHRRAIARVANPWTTLWATSGVCSGSQTISPTPMCGIALPNLPRVKGIEAAIFTFVGNDSSWSTLLKHCTNCSSWCEPNFWVNSGSTVLIKKFALARAQNRRSSG